ncbi:hypothetical protein HOY82DRAFT_575982 [Tuber indicum]|nr:hypothetical protein HOY82DRAFT_575982 [Tuber indicum]
MDDWLIACLFPPPPPFPGFAFSNRWNGLPVGRLRKCNHAFCAECVRGKMTTREGIVCAFCGRVAELLVGISAPMSMPGEDDVVLTNVVVLQESKVVEIG